MMYLLLALGCAENAADSSRDVERMDGSTGASAKISIDDLPSWQAVGRDAYAEVGISVGAGDFDGDGQSDLVVGGTVGTLHGRAKAGTVLLFDGPLGPTTEPRDARSASAVLHGTERDDSSIVCPVAAL